MIGLEEIRRCDEHPDVDFSDENEVKRFVRPMKWLSLNAGNFRLLRINVRLPAIVLASLRRATRSFFVLFREPPLAARAYHPRNEEDAPVSPEWRVHLRSRPPTRDVAVCDTLVGV